MSNCSVRRQSNRTAGRSPGGGSADTGSHFGQVRWSVSNQVSHGSVSQRIGEQPRGASNGHTEPARRAPAVPRAPRKTGPKPLRSRNVLPVYAMFSRSMQWFPRSNDVHGANALSTPAQALPYTLLKPSCFSRTHARGADRPPPRFVHVLAFRWLRPSHQRRASLSHGALPRSRAFVCSQRVRRARCAAAALPWSSRQCRRESPSSRAPGLRRGEPCASEWTAAGRPGYPGHTLDPAPWCSSVHWKPCRCRGDGP
jgi:hypothetical protein